MHINIWKEENKKKQGVSTDIIYDKYRADRKFKSDLRHRTSKVIKNFHLNHEYCQDWKMTCIRKSKLHNSAVEMALKAVVSETQIENC